MEVHLAIKLVDRHYTFNNLKEAIEINLKSQVEEVGYV